MCRRDKCDHNDHYKMKQGDQTSASEEAKDRYTFHHLNLNKKFSKLCINDFQI